MMYGDSFVLKKSGINILYADPTRLLVKVQVASCLYLLVSIHAPHQCHHVEVGRWWGNTTSILTPYLDNMVVYVCVDASTYFPFSQQVPLGPGHGGKHYQDFANFLEDCAMSAPFCHAANHSLALSPTFAAQGSAKFSAYILCDRRAIVVPKSLAVLDDFDMASRTDNHLRVITCFYNINNRKSDAAFASRRIPGYDRHEAKKGTNATVLNNSLLAHCTMVYDVDPSSHVFLLESHFRDCLATAFPKPKRTTKKQYPTSGTMTLIEARANLCGRIRALGRSIIMCFTSAVFDQWKCQSKCALLYNSSVQVDTRQYYNCMKVRAPLKKRARHLQSRVKTALDDDHLNNFRSAAESIEEALRTQDYSTIYDVLRKLYKCFQ